MQRAQQAEENNSADQFHQGWSNRDPYYDQQPQYPPQQNGLQIIVNLPPQQQAYGQDRDVYSNNLYNQPNDNYNQGHDGYNPSGYQPYQTPVDNNAYGQNYDDTDRLPARPEDKYKVNDDQPNQDYASPQEKQPAVESMSMGCGALEKKISHKTMGCLIIFFAVANLAVLISLLVYHFGKKEITLTSVSGALAYIGFNLGEHPVMDVRVVDGNLGCPSGYYSILLGTWPGTNIGCDCPITGLKAGACKRSGKHKTDLLCTDISRRSSIDMFNWGGSKWCVYRAKPGTEYTKTIECGAGFRECSTGICVLSSLSCPVTKVKIANTGTYKLKVGTDRYIVTENVQGESPVIDLAITPNNIPCFSEDYFAAGPTSPYKLIDENERGCSKYGLDSDYSFQFDVQTQDKLFTQNSFPSRVMDLPDYDDTYDNTNSVLTYRKRMDVAENDFCLNIDLALIEKSSKAADDMNRFMTGTSIAAIIIHGILFLFMSVFVGSTVFQKGWKSALEKESLESIMVPLTFFGVVEYIDLIVMFATTKKYRGIMLATDEYFVKLSGMNCFLAGQAQAVVKDYQMLVDDVAGSLYKHSLTLFLICTFCCVIPCIYLCVKSAKK